ncbi:alpha/beta fold hydrolase, partial [Candidatus Aminicenantes bacterium AC-335-G13]|nr:alpha/beta fold hydrolase [Candidatus Aminicenantes bacterium AC-335-G13]
WKNEGYIDYTSVNGDNFKLDYSLLKEAEEINVYKIASEIKIPVLIVHGDHDESVPLNQSKNLASLLKNCKLEIIKGADHRYSDSKHFNKMISLISDFIIKNF